MTQFFEKPPRETEKQKRERQIDQANEDMLFAKVERDFFAAHGRYPESDEDFDWVAERVFQRSPSEVALR
jgi:hypothetical protein